MALPNQKGLMLHSFEDKNIVLDIFVDFIKACDYMNLDLLLKKPDIYVIGALALYMLSSYLKYRKQCVYTNSYSSKVQPILFGVSHGSILGPLLFNTYLNDILTVSASATVVITQVSLAYFLLAIRWDDLIATANETLFSLNVRSECNSQNEHEQN